MTSSVDTSLIFNIILGKTKQGKCLCEV